MKYVALFGFALAGFLGAANAADNSVPSWHWDSNEVVMQVNAKSGSANITEKAVWRKAENNADLQSGVNNKPQFDGELGW